MAHSMHTGIPNVDFCYPLEKAGWTSELVWLYASARSQNLIPQSSSWQSVHYAGCWMWEIMSVGCCCYWRSRYRQLL